MDRRIPFVIPICWEQDSGVGNVRDILIFTFVGVKANKLSTPLNAPFRSSKHDARPRIVLLIVFVKQAHLIESLAIGLDS